MNVKNSCKAIIINNGEVLLNYSVNEQGEKYYILPGGGQNEGESMQETVIRECLEETGYKVKIKKMAAIGERICGGIHKIYHVFLCILENNIKQKPTNQDVNQKGSEWVKLSFDIPLYPIFIRNRFIEMINSSSIIDLGFEKDNSFMIERGYITIKYLQAYIKSKDNKNGFENIYFIKLIEEAGELARQLINGPNRADNKNIKNTLEEELWDMIYYIIAIANLYNIDLEKWIPKKEEYNNERYHNGFKFDPEEWNLMS